MAGSGDLSTITSKTGENVVRKPRGRPAGSKNKPKPPIIITRDSPNTLRAHAMEVSPGCDIGESLATFARRKQQGVWVLSATGFVSNVMLRQPSMSSAGPGSGPVVTLHGRFEILSLVGSVLPPPAPLGVTGLAIYLVGPQGQVVGGAIAGPLMASGPVVIMAATFMNATFDRLPIDKDEAIATAATHDQLHGRAIGVSDIYAPSQNMTTLPPPEIYTWSMARPLSKA
ncbi:putative AT-hook motif nuclear-localized protein 15-29 [Helianthus annuus]|uniref:AT-hook motif nuclear-localized protein 15-29 n=1 Tax=Helianthus annuus TaxID=4232 RepID=A0A251U6Y1_HELAN|nr:AT-hook motif nuclear-localized protein 16 [Helianthus annuus]KAF5807287.1 putative AT-hook motif nuclear-localized protein 15-29 [Helianthus annuus]KAJ0585798.1 putative AT-hook motif nuclear-localized protein 15-29 [Helianthus annuus]KAJ0920430.1 putative AT-hook motif nuclear-localized protein 15-29 [Helianthus annuus]